MTSPRERMLRELGRVRRAEQQATLRGKLRALEIPMAPEVRLAPATDDMPGAAQTDGTTIYTQGRIDRRTLAHEMGHNLDAQVMTDADRARLAAIMRRLGRPWESYEQQPGASHQSTQHGSPSEAFADMYAMLATRQYPRRGRGESGYLDKPPTLRELLRLGRSLERLGRRNDLGRYRRPKQP